MSRLRHVLDDGDIVGARDGYVLQAAPHEIDAVNFERLAAEGRRLSWTDPIEAAAVLREALRLWRGPAWGELAYESALSSDAARLSELKLDVTEDHLASELATGGAAEFVGELRTLVFDGLPRLRYTNVCTSCRTRARTARLQIVRTSSASSPWTSAPRMRRSYARRAFATHAHIVTVHARRGVAASTECGPSRRKDRGR